MLQAQEVFLTQQYICIAMEYASGGNLFNYVQRAQRLKEPAARWFFQQLIIGLDYCHIKGEGRGSAKGEAGCWPGQALSIHELATRLVFLKLIAGFSYCHKRVSCGAKPLQLSPGRISCS